MTAFSRSLVCYLSPYSLLYPAPLLLTPLSYSHFYPPFHSLPPFNYPCSIIPLYVIASYFPSHESRTFWWFPTNFLTSMVIANETHTHIWRFKAKTHKWEKLWCSFWVWVSSLSCEWKCIYKIFRSVVGVENIIPYIYFSVVFLSHNGFSCQISNWKLIPSCFSLETSLAMCTEHFLSLCRSTLAFELSQNSMWRQSSTILRCLDFLLSSCWEPCK